MKHNKRDEEKWYAAYSIFPKTYELFSRREDAENITIKELKKNFSFKNKNVLDIGCGAGKYVKALAPLCKKYYALDISQEMLKRTRNKCNTMKNVEYLLANSKNIPLKDSSVDIVFSSWGLSMKFISKTMKEVNRVLKPGGELIALGNHFSGAFMEMRGKSQIRRDKRTMKILDKKYGLAVQKIIATKFKFASLAEAKKVCSQLFGKNAITYLHDHPSRIIEHNVLLQHKKK